MLSFCNNVYSPDNDGTWKPTVFSSYQLNTGVTIGGVANQQGTLPTGVTQIPVTGQAQTAFTNWDFSSIWKTFTGNGFPVFNWQN